ncbi:MAG: CPBP family intramembrane metalloprotease [Candidatus Sericytochromatia bacterium]|nr:CPBP family intramembrane metalloprotease [Candidatus Sericytochromatia bacterium]
MKKYIQCSILIAICIKISITLSFFSSVYTNFIWKKYFVGADTDTYTTIFYTYPVLVGLLATFYNPKNYGLLPAKTLEYWKICLLWTLIIIVPILTYLKTGPTTPFHGMTWQVFILAPIGEELIFRGAFFTWINQVLKDIFTDNEKIIMIWTIIFSAVSFGAWHISNITVEPNFTLFQVAYTTMIGFVLGYLRYKTKSIYTGIFIHIIINFLATVS